MRSYLSKVGYSLFTILIAVTLLFFVIRLAPGDPIERILGPEASVEDIEKYREQLGLNLSISKQYFSYVIGILRGDLGQSLFKRRDVFELITSHMSPTILLAFISISISSPLGVLIGVWAAIKRSGFVDNGLRVLTLLALSFPIFSLAPILVLFFSIKLGLLPVSEWGSLRHMALPVLTLVIPLSSIISRVTRNKFLEEHQEQWVQVLRAKGIMESGVNFRIIKVCLPTILNIVAIQLSVVLAGTMITETIFDIPGMGLLLLEAISNRDYPLVQGLVIYSTIIYMGVYFIIDFINSLIDPRIEG